MRFWPNRCFMLYGWSECDHTQTIVFMRSGCYLKTLGEGSWLSQHLRTPRVVFFSYRWHFAHRSDPEHHVSSQRIHQQVASALTDLFVLHCFLNYGPQDIARKAQVILSCVRQGYTFFIPAFGRPTPHHNTFHVMFCVRCRGQYLRFLYRPFFRKAPYARIELANHQVDWCV